jgi:hypothetical protein
MMAIVLCTLLLQESDSALQTNTTACQTSRDDNFVNYDNSSHAADKVGIHIFNVKCRMPTIKTIIDLSDIVASLFVCLVDTIYNCISMLSFIAFSQYGATCFLRQCRDGLQSGVQEHEDIAATDNVRIFIVKWKT